MKITQSDLINLYEEFNKFFDGIIKDNKVAILFAQVLGIGIRTIYHYGDPDKTNNNLHFWRTPAIPPEYYRIFISFLNDQHNELYGEQLFILNGDISNEFIEIIRHLSDIMERWKKDEPITRMQKDDVLKLVDKLFAEVEQKQKDRIQ